MFVGAQVLGNTMQLDDNNDNDKNYNNNTSGDDADDNNDNDKLESTGALPGERISAESCENCLLRSMVSTNDDKVIVQISC